MRVGTKSVLFGAHQFIIHPIFLFIAWWRLYGFPKDPRLWVVFLLHDIGYWGKPNMDGEEGESHPEVGANIVSKLFDGDITEDTIFYSEGYNNEDLWKYAIMKVKPKDGNFWYRFSLYHSRFYSKRNDTKYSPLCIADKLAVAMEPWWFYLPRVIASGEIKEYMRDGELGAKGEGKYAGEIHTKLKYNNRRHWFRECKHMMRTWALDHMYGDEDLVTLAIQGDDSF